MSNLKIDQEEFNHKAQHILDTVVKPQVERYEKAKAEEKLINQNKMSAVEFLHSKYIKIFGELNPSTAQLYEIAYALEQAKEMEKEQTIQAFNLGVYDGGGIIKKYKMSGEQYYNQTFKSE